MKTLNWHNPENLTDAQIGTKDGWRLLLEEELNSPPDDSQYYGSRKKWKMSLEKDEIHSTQYSYRTREPLPEWAASSKLENQPDGQEGWIKWSDRQPVEEDLPIKFTRMGWKAYEQCPVLFDPHTPGDCYWMHDDTPPIPPRELTQEEKDEKWLSDWKLSEWRHSTKPLSHADVDAAVKAAISYARKQP